MNCAQCSQEEQLLPPLPKGWNFFFLGFSLALPAKAERTASELKSPRSFLILFVLRELEGAGLLLSLAMASSEPLGNGCLPYKALPAGPSYWEPQRKTALPNVSDCWGEHEIKPKTTRGTDEQRNSDILFGVKAVPPHHAGEESQQLAALGHRSVVTAPRPGPMPSTGLERGSNHLTAHLGTLLPSSSQSLYVGLEVHNPHFAEGWGCCSDFPKLTQEAWAEPTADHRFSACQVTSSALG